MYEEEKTGTPAHEAWLDRLEGYIAQLERDEKDNFVDRDLWDGDEMNARDILLALRFVVRDLRW